MRVRIPGPRGWQILTFDGPLPQPIQARLDAGSAFIVEGEDVRVDVPMETAAVEPSRGSTMKRIRTRAAQRLEEALLTADKLITRGGQKGRKLVACRLIG